MRSKFGVIPAVGVKTTIGWKIRMLKFRTILRFSKNSFIYPVVGLVRLNLL